MPLARANVYKWFIISGIYAMILTILPEINSRYCDYRKASVKNKKSGLVNRRGKMKTFLKYPMKITWNDCK